MRKLLTASAICSAFFAAEVSAEPFQEVTIGVPVASLAEAEEWYLDFLGRDAEMMKPVPGIVEFKVAPGVWLQLFEAGSEQTAGHTVRFLVDDMEKAQASRSENQINTGEAIEIPGVVIYSEFSDPFGNALGFYEIP